MSVTRLAKHILGNRFHCRSGSAKTERRDMNVRPMVNLPASAKNINIVLLVCSFNEIQTRVALPVIHCITNQIFCFIYTAITTFLLDDLGMHV